MSYSVKPKKSGVFVTALLFAAVVLVALLIVGVLVFVLPSDRDSVSQKPSDSTSKTFVLDDTITLTTWGEAATIVSHEDSPVESAHLGYTYGVIEQGAKIVLSGTIVNDENISEVWYHPLVGVYSGETGFVCRMDNWVVGSSPDGLFTNEFSESPINGIADSSSALWAVYMSGDSWTAETAKMSDSYSVSFEYGVSGVISITQTIVFDEGESLTQIYSVRVPEGEYNTYFYGEHCSYTFSSMTVINFESEEIANEL